MLHPIYLRSKPGSFSRETCSKCPLYIVRNVWGFSGKTNLCIGEFGVLKRNTSKEHTHTVNKQCRYK